MIPTWLPLSPADADAVRRLADQAHPSLPERAAVFADRIHLFPGGCRRLLLHGELAGYAIAHPWLFEQPPPLDTVFGILPTPADCLHIHDIVVAPALRGHGLAGEFLDAMATVASRHRLPRLTLVSVNDTHPLWSRFGFAIREAPALATKLAGYGSTARYMVRELR